MKFVASLTMNSSDLRHILRCWAASDDPRNPFAHVLISPLFAQPSTLRIVREELKEKRGSELYFDSGGYQVQQDRVAYAELYQRLMDFYRQNPWADWYVLPDYVPTSKDDARTVEHKVRATMTVGRLFYQEMPDKLKGRAVPVIHGHNNRQVLACMEAFAPILPRQVGFGSFGTSGGSSGVNTITDRSVGILRFLLQLTAEKGLGVHVFGVSTPPMLFYFSLLGVASFDSLAWMRAAGYGNVFLPLVRGYMITYRVIRRKHTCRSQFDYLKALTGHSCAFCDDFTMLTESRLYRIMHNLTCVLDTLDLVAGSSASSAEVIRVISEGSPAYLRYGKVVEECQR